MHLGLTKSRDDKLLQDLLDKKLRVIVVFEDDYLNHIARIAYKDIQQDNYTYRIGEYNIYKGEEWGFCDFCKRHDCYFIVPNETIESGSSEIPKDLLDAQVEIVEKLIGENNNDGANAAHPFACEYVVELLQKAVSAGAKWQEEKEKEYSPWLVIPKLKEAALEFGEQAKDYEIGGQSFAEDMAIAFTRGAEWQKEQMLKDAVEGEVCIPNVWVEHKEGKELVVRAEISKELGFKFGDNVRIIIVKED